MILIKYHRKSNNSITEIIHLHSANVNDDGVCGILDT